MQRKVKLIKTPLILKYTLMLTQPKLHNSIGGKNSQKIQRGNETRFINQ